MADRASYTQTVAAPPQACFDAIVDFESYPEWQSAVKDCTVLERGDDGLARVVETVIDLKVRSLRYVLRYSYERPHAIGWEYVEGDLKSIDGGYELSRAKGGATDITYTVGVDIGFFVPGPLKSRIAKIAMRDSVNEIKVRVEG